tara:strand:+ start:3225 stop:3887 length:663 start_codon:yes stop_codon:yes gene_type:complete
MLNIKIYHWNLFLKKENIFDSDCGYHALINGNMMLNEINKCKNSLNNSNYIFNLKQKINNINMYKNIDDEINNLKILLCSSKLSNNNLQYIINNSNLDKNIIIYENNKNIKDKINSKYYKICIIFYKELLYFIKHWVPIVIHRENNNVYIHILDSFNLVWSGDKVLQNIIDSLFPNKNIQYKKKIIIGRIFFFGNLIFQLIIILIALYVFMNGMKKYINL